MRNNREVIAQLDNIMFHDVPVKGIYLQSDGERKIEIDYFLYVEKISDYEEYTIVFSEIKKADIGKLSLTDEIEITRFDYFMKGDYFCCEIYFLLGTSQPSFEISLECGNIEVIKKQSIN